MLTSLYVKSVVALEQFRKDERGVTAIEYALVGVAIAGIVAAAFAAKNDNGSTLQAAFEAAFTKIANTINPKSGT